MNKLTTQHNEIADISACELRRFVVLLHSHPDGDHYDLMIENGPRLATWKFLHPPEAALQKELQGMRIGEHRLIYLDYEGPVSGNRGDVRRHDEGRCEVRVQMDELWEVTFDGRHIRGTFQLQKVDQGREEWALRRS